MSNNGYNPEGVNNVDPENTPVNEPSVTGTVNDLMHATYQGAQNARNAANSINNLATGVNRKLNHPNGVSDNQSDNNTNNNQNNDIQNNNTKNNNLQSSNTSGDLPENNNETNNLNTKNNNQDTSNPNQDIAKGVNVPQGQTPEKKSNMPGEKRDSDNKKTDKKEVKEKNNKGKKPEGNKINKKGMRRLGGVATGVMNRVRKRVTGNKDENDTPESEVSDNQREEESSNNGRVGTLLAFIPLQYRVVVVVGAPIILGIIIILLLLALFVTTTTVTTMASFCEVDESSNVASDYNGTGKIKDFLCAMQNPFGDDYNHIVTCKAGDTVYHKDHKHEGIDIGCSLNDPIYAVQTGKVVAKGYMGGRGNAIFLDHGDFGTVYQHLNSIANLKIGDKVKKGEQVGKCGNTGNSDGPHLHFEITDHPENPYHHFLLAPNDYFGPENSSIKKGIQNIKKSCGSSWGGDSTGSSGASARLSNTIQSASSSSSSKVFPKYSLSKSQLKQIANLCSQEQGSPKGAAAEASQMANSFELHGSSFGKGADGLYKYVRNSGWYAGASTYMDGGSSSKKVVAAVKSVLVDGKRTLPKYVDQHYTNCYAGSWVENNGKRFDCSNRKAFVPHKTIFHENSSTKWIFYSFPTKDSDPFGYSSKKNREKYGEAHYDFKTGKAVDGASTTEDDQTECCDTSSSSSSSSSSSETSVDKLPPSITKEMLNKMLEVQKKYGVYASLIIAQKIEESGADETKGEPALECNNLFGITGTGNAGKCNGGKFAKYKSFDDSIEAYGKLIASDSYQSLIKKANAKTPTEWLEAYGPTYCPDEGYVNTVKSIMKTYDLEKYDDATSSSDTCSLGGDSTFNGKIYVFTQGQEPWRNKDYCHAGRPYRKNACGPTAMAIVVSSLLNEKHTPLELGNASKYCAYESFSFFSDTAKKYGLTYKFIDCGHAGGCTAKQYNEVLSALNSKKYLAIVNVGAGIFTEGGHYMALTGVNGEDVMVQNPSGKEPGINGRADKCSRKGVCWNSGKANFKKSINVTAKNYMLFSKK